MFSTIKEIFGGGNIVEKGAELIDGAFYTKQEQTADKKEIEQMRYKARVDLLSAYAPFKKAQRLLAIIFSIEFILLLNTAVIMLFFNKDIKLLLQLVESFHLHWIMLAIIGFYFSAGFAEGIISKIKQPKK